jgi:hypothetical protein
MTTAYLLLRLAFGTPDRRRHPMRFDRIVDAVARGEVDAGLIIHESRFTYANERAGASGRPRPVVGGRDGTPDSARRDPRAARRPDGLTRDDRRTIRRSLAFARDNDAAVAPYVREHAFEMDERVMRAHIGALRQRVFARRGRRRSGGDRRTVRPGRRRGLVPDAAPHPSSSGVNARAFARDSAGASARPPFASPRKRRVRPLAGRERRARRRGLSQRSLARPARALRRRRHESNRRHLALETIVDAIRRNPEICSKRSTRPSTACAAIKPAGAYVPSYVDARSGLPVYSLYGATRKPSAAMLAGVDVLLFDIQDVGDRAYTYISTLAYVMQAAKIVHKEVWVLDRPNPIGGSVVEGPVLDPRFSSFIGLYPIAGPPRMTSASSRASTTTTSASAVRCA